MSHISKIELEINSIDMLKKACQRLQLEFCEGQKTYTWYGKWVGDTPLPEGISIDALGKCDHAIRVPGANYEIGIVKTGNKYRLLYDYWRAGKLEKVLGKGLGKLKQAYTIERVNQEARFKGYRIQEKKMDKSIRLVMTV